LPELTLKVSHKSFQKKTSKQFWKTGKKICRYGNALKNQRKVYLVTRKENPIVSQRRRKQEKKKKKEIVKIARINANASQDLW